MPPTTTTALPRAIRLFTTTTHHGSLSHVRNVSHRPYSTAPSPKLLSIIDIPAAHTGSIRVLSLNRPAARNAISVQLLAELGHEIHALHSQGATGETRALVLASAVDSVFCAGADLKERRGFTTQQTTDFLTSLRATFASIASLPMPTISAISSVALGGGLELALTTHFRVLASTASVGLPETRLAILPGAGGTYRLPAVIGATRARDLILTGRRVPGYEAYGLGLADRLVECEGLEAAEAKEKVLEEAVALASEICEGGPVAIREALRAVGRWKEGERAENEGYDVVAKTADRNEALAAFGEKRKAVFRGV